MDVRRRGEYKVNRLDLLVTIVGAVMVAGGIVVVLAGANWLTRIVAEVLNLDASSSYEQDDSTKDE